MNERGAALLATFQEEEKLLVSRKGRRDWKTIAVIWASLLVPTGWEGAGSTGHPGLGTACLVDLPWSDRCLTPRLTDRLSKNNTDLSREREVEMEISLSVPLLAFCSLNWNNILHSPSPFSFTGLENVYAVWE